jgi:hypothetical protein
LWTGTAESWVDLSPAGATDSFANAVFDGRQVGFAIVGGNWRAGIWSGTAESWVDLSAFVPGSFGNTNARSIWSDEQFVYVAGYGFNNATQREEALLWTRAIPGPSTGAAVMLLAALFAKRRR